MALQAQAAVRLPKIFGSHMVLQQGKPLIFWGWADSGEGVSVTIGSDTRQTTASDKGEWKVVLPAQKAGGPITVRVAGSNTVLLEDVLVGEVWLASGQSNMEMGIGACRNGKEEIAAASHPQIRLFMVANRWKSEPQADLEESNSKGEGLWKVCSPETVAEGGWSGFSGAAYYFGRELQQKLGAPVGLIDATWGGTRIESWTPPEGFASVPALEAEYAKVQLADARTPSHREKLQLVLRQTEEWLGAARQALSDRRFPPAMPAYPQELLPPGQLQAATALYNGMIHPVQPLAVRGFIWYQGEANASEGALYTERMKALVQGWRKVWGDSDLAFYYVQIAPYTYGMSGERIGEFWEAQARAQEVPDTGMVVINDIGDLKDIHPVNKQDVGRRLAAWALAKQYGKSVVYSGPTFKSMKTEGNILRVTFDNTAGGLKARDNKRLTWFEVIDADEGGFVKAEARIEGDSVLLSAPGVKKPVAMRFAWHMSAEPNLANGAGLPVGAFRAGEAPRRDWLGMHVPEAAGYKTVLELDLAKLQREVVYDRDDRAKVASGFDRIAYFVELQDQGGESRFVYVSMDAFTDSLDKIGIPTVASGARFQTKVSRMNVFSNLRDIVTGTNLSGGNIEFWPDNYGAANGAGIPNASGETFDFGDKPSNPRDGYGSMQVHNHQARQTLFAINHWVDGAKADVGIGSQPKGNADWTFAANASNWAVKRLRVLVRPK